MGTLNFLRMQVLFFCLSVNEFLVSFLGVGSGGSHRPSTEWNWLWSVLISVKRITSWLVWISYRDSRRLREIQKNKKKWGERLKKKKVFFILPVFFEFNKGRDILTATTGYYFHWRGQLLESPLAPRRAFSLSRLFFSPSKNLKLTEPNQEHIKQLVSTAAAKLRIP